jgi:predicted N-acetyltransferase YhbS
MLHVRDAQAEDLTAIRTLLLQLPIEPETELGDDGKAAAAYAAISAQSGHSLMVIEDDGEIIGTLVLLIVPNLTHDAAPWAILENFVVDGDRRGQHVGRELLAAAVTRARAAGCYKVQLLSNNAREGAHRFYGAFGFEPSAQGFRLYLH